MAITTIIKEVKKIHNQELVIIKIGNFYHCYGKDSYIISYLLGYKLKKTKENYYVCGFPIKSIAKVENILEHKKINYMILDRKNNYDVDVFENYKNLNKYQEIYENIRNNGYSNDKKEIPKKDIDIKVRIRDESYSLLELAYKANSIKDIDYKNRLLDESIAKLKLIDFLINLSYDKKIIPNKRYLKLGYTLDNIAKYMTGWKKNINV